MTRMLFPVLFWSALLWAPPMLAIAFANLTWLVMWGAIALALFVEALEE